MRSAQSAPPSSLASDREVSTTKRTSLGVALIRTARRHPLRLALADQLRGPMRYLEVLAGSIALARALRDQWKDQERVGVLLPPSVGGALVNLAATLAGRVTVNLNYVIGERGIAVASRRAALKTVITSRQFVAKARIEVPDALNVVWLEEVAAAIGVRERVLGVGLALAAPVTVIGRAIGAWTLPNADDDSTVIFSSGSTGDPKGVRLSHSNVLSNAQAARTVLQFGTGDRLVHLLPFFHSFGNFMLWAGVRSGAALIFIPNPLDAAAVGTMVERHRGTILCATPTLLDHYRRRVRVDQFASLRIVVAGAEKLSGHTAASFKQQFGKDILQGYGCTECAPVIAVNAPTRGGAKAGTVGRPLPGVRVRVVHPDTFEPLPRGVSGMILVKGPNVMRGYLDQDDLTASVMRNGWYVTGDIGSLDEDGFITITDRLARFSKIGGEMIPHGKVEEILHEVVERETQVFAVTSVTDGRKGERLAVVHVHDQARVQEICRTLSARGMPNLFIPKPNDFVRVPALPVLGSGKVDLQAVKRLAAERLGAEGHIEA